MSKSEKTNMHASAVAVQGNALLIKGASGSGKSGIALEMMARGAVLIADDRVDLSRDGKSIWLSAPAPLKGMIEARGIGLLHADTLSTAKLIAVLDLDGPPPERLPRKRDVQLLDIEIPLLTYHPSPYFCAGLVQYLKGGRLETE